MDWRDLYTVHDGCKDYKCEFCGKLSTTAGHLKKHIHTIHEGNKEYKCESCGKSFSKAHILKKHIQDEGGLKVHPQCSCFNNKEVKPDATSFYIHLGAFPSKVRLRLEMEKRCGLEKNENALRIEEAIPCTQEGKSESGCPIAKYIVKRKSNVEKFLIIGNKI